MSIITAVYNALTADPEIIGLLAKDPLTNAAAVYETWAADIADMPYIVQTHEQRKGNHFAKIDALAIFDIIHCADFARSADYIMRSCCAACWRECGKIAAC